MVEEKPFRVLLDFSELNLNLSKYIWMSVSPREFNNIADFKNAILRKINLDKKDIKLFVHDGLLLEDEKIIVLRENDTVKVQYADQNQAASCNLSLSRSYLSQYSEPENNSENCNKAGMEKLSSKKRKSHSTLFDTLEEYELHPKIPKKKKKCKQSPNKSVPEENTSVLTSNGAVFDPIINKNEISNASIKMSEEIESQISENNVTRNEGVSFETAFDSTQSSILGTNCKKKKRKRHKKRKKVPEVLNTIADVNGLSELQLENLESCIVSENYSAVRKHIRFTSPGPDLNITQDENADLVDLDTYVKKFKSKSSIRVPGCEMQTPDNATKETYITHKNSTPTSPNLAVKDSWNISPMENDYSTAIELASISKGKGESTEEKKLSYLDYPILNCLPAVGTHIAYKVLELDENYSPSVSTYKEGIVKKIDLVTEEMEIELFKTEIKPGRIGKFENLGPDEIPMPEVIKNVMVPWSSMIEPRCIKN